MSSLFLRPQSFPGDLTSISWAEDEHVDFLLLLPSFVSLLSIVTLVARMGTHYAFELRAHQGAGNDGQQVEETHTDALRRVVAKNGGTIAFLWMVARLLGCIVLVAGSVPPALNRVSLKLVGGPQAYQALLLANIYTLILASFAIAARDQLRKWLIQHNVAILLVELGIYAYRDVWPLATFNGQPMALTEGWLLWVKVCALVLTAIVVPLSIPSVYAPLNPKDLSASQPHPEQIASLVSLYTYTYLSPTINAANKTAHLTPEHFPTIADYDRSQALSTRALPYLDPVKVRKGRHIVFALLRLFAFDYFSAVTAMTFFSVSQFVAPLAINRLLTLLEPGGSQATLIRPWFWIVCLLIAPVGGSLAFNSYTVTMTHTTVRTESILTRLIFDHSLRVRVKAETLESSDGDLSSNDLEQPGQGGTQSSHSPSERKDTSSFIGQLNNLVTVDLDNVTGSRDLALLFYFVPLQLIGASLFLYAILGWSAFVGLAIMVTLLPVPGYMAKMMQDVQKEKMKKTDERTQNVTESMNVLRMIKMFGWEKRVRERVDQRREEELVWIWKEKFLSLSVAIVTFMLPTSTMLITYATLTLVMKRELTAAIVFPSIVLFDVMRGELQRASTLLPRVVKGKVSIDRFDAFFKETELLDSHEAADNVSIGLQQESVPEVLGLDLDVIGFRNASFTWNREGAGAGESTPSSQFRLTIPGELQFVKGKINLIVGPTGSGKTSLLMSLLGEMHFAPTHPDSMFSLPRAGGVSFAVQESWVQNETIRENILFHSPYDKERYLKVLYQCALEQDLEMFEAGDQTEWKITLDFSGGQKARLTLARAIYSSAEIILLDDVLAALDVHTSIWIVKKCLQGDLVKGRTVLLVTHNIALAGPIAKFVVTVSADGVVTGLGNNISAALLSEPAIQAELRKEEPAIGDQIELIDKPSPKDSQVAGKLIVAEEVQHGSVSWRAIMTFLKALGGDHFYVYLTVWISFIAFQDFVHIFSVWYMGFWSSQYETHPAEDVPVFRFIWTYVLLILVMVVTHTLKQSMWYLGSMRASRTIHKMLFDFILGATLRWLDETPVSRVLTRMTQDINSVDGQLTLEVEILGGLVILAVVELVAAVWFVPWFSIPGLVIAVVGIYMGSQYLKAQMSVKRELSNAKAPMLAHFGAAMAGLVSIRAYGAESEFMNESKKRIDYYVKIARLNWDLNRWFAVRMDVLGAIFTASLAAYLTYGSNITSANVGFSLDRATVFCAALLLVVRHFNEFQVEANSMERIVAYTEIEQEPKFTESGVPPASWPTSGEIRVANLSARYSKTGPAVLHGISFDLRAGERVGVVGRTGSGKSSLTLALLRCIPTDGTVHFDGLETQQVNLDSLRANITIIPQMPELLSGTLRYNLDPFEEHDDATLNAALRSSGLNSLQNESGNSNRLTLDSNISSGGSNVSVGQRQIIALARAIVRSSKLLILDEATSAIDHETDSVIQNALRRELGSDVTVLTIAHRLQTIMDADRVMVLDAGHIVEFASPADLLLKKQGLFKALADESGDEEQLYEVAGKNSKGSMSQW